MKAAHPNVKRIAILAVAVCAALCGCRSRSGMAVNPFLAPDRVPPPATRAILPGQAQPYYPGDPLPVMQSAAPPAQAPTNSAVAWNSPGHSQPAANTQNAAAALAFSKESTVAIPTDSDSLRFPTSQPADVAPTIAMATDTSINSPSQPAVQQSVVPAAYYEEVESEANLQPQLNSLANVPPASSPWRSPQVASPAQMTAAPANMPQIALAQPPNSMAVRMRAVESPPIPTSAPRIRLPGYAPAQQPPAAPAYGTIVQPAFGGVLQTVQTTPIPPNALSAGPNLAALPAAMTSGDGFRPRGSMR